MPLGAARLSFLAKAAAAGAAVRNVVTAYGDAQVDTAYSQFGGASAYLDGTGDYLEIENDFLFGTSDDFTIEFWYKKHTTNTTEQLASNRGSYTTGHWYMQFDHTTDKIQWGVFGAAAQRSTSTFDDTNWHHVALVRDSSVFELFVDGTSQGTLSGSYQWGRSGENYKFGWVAGGAGNISIDEIRISDTPRYTSAFTPSTSAFQNDANTLALVHCDGVDGSTVFTDDNVTPLGAGGFTTELTVSGTDYRFHVFDSQSTDNFVVSDSSNVDVILIGGGGGGRSGYFYGGGGGGAGQVLLQTSVAVTAQTYTMTVGSGGPGGQHNDSLASGGTTTAFSYSAIGGDPAQFKSGSTDAQNGGASGNGFSGGSGANSGTNSYDSGGGGAGATQNGDGAFLSSSAPRDSCGTGGDGYDLTSFIGSGNTLTLRNSSDIVGLEVARGGNGARDSATDVTSFGTGANAFYNTGLWDGSNGTGGAIIIRYEI